MPVFCGRLGGGRFINLREEDKEEDGSIQVVYPLLRLGVE